MTFSIRNEIFFIYLSVSSQQYQGPTIGRLATVSVQGAVSPQAQAQGRFISFSNAVLTRSLQLIQSEKTSSLPLNAEFNEAGQSPEAPRLIRLVTSKVTDRFLRWRAPEPDLKFISPDY